MADSFEENINKSRFPGKFQFRSASNVSSKMNIYDNLEPITTENKKQMENGFFKNSNCYNIIQSQFKKQTSLIIGSSLDDCFSNKQTKVESGFSENTSVNFDELNLNNANNVEGKITNTITNSSAKTFEIIVNADNLEMSIDETIKKEIHNNDTDIVKTENIDINNNKENLDEATTNNTIKILEKNLLKEKENKTCNSIGLEIIENNCEVNKNSHNRIEINNQNDLTINSSEISTGDKFHLNNFSKLNSIINVQNEIETENENGLKMNLSEKAADDKLNSNDYIDSNNIIKTQFEIEKESDLKNNSKEISTDEKLYSNAYINLNSVIKTQSGIEIENENGEKINSNEISTDEQLYSNAFSNSNTILIAQNKNDSEYEKGLKINSSKNSTDEQLYSNLFSNSNNILIVQNKTEIEYDKGLKVNSNEYSSDDKLSSVSISNSNNINKTDCQQNFGIDDSMLENKSTAKSNFKNKLGSQSVREDYNLNSVPEFVNYKLKSRKSIAIPLKPNEPLKMAETPAWKKILQEKFKEKKEKKSATSRCYEDTSSLAQVNDNVLPNWKQEIDEIKKQKSINSDKTESSNDIPEWIVLQEERVKRQKSLSPPNED